MSPNAPRPYLFSVDLEDIRLMFPEGARYPERIPVNTERFLDFLAAHDARCTFFVVGDVARRYPELVRRIVAEGHEVASHSSDHIPLDQLDPQRLRDDLQRSRDDLAAAGAERVVGFRAPGGSIKKETRWAYEVLRELGFLYSSSVLPAANPIHGWPDFGPDTPRREDGVWELPMTLSHVPGLRVPFLGGVYFRVLPFALIRQQIERRFAAGHAALGYVHAHDIDADQDRFMHPQIDDNRFFNWLMYLNRTGTLARVERLLRTGASIVPYVDYVESNLEGGAANA